MNEKCCTRCGQTKPVEGFATYRYKGRLGYRGECKVCNRTRWGHVRAAHNKRYYDNNTNGYADKAKERAAEAHKANREIRRAANRRYEARHPERAAARHAVMMAVRSGVLVPQPCEVCGEKAEAHHDDYGCPLRVRWLCRKHHAAHHRMLRRKQDSGLRPGVPLVLPGYGVVQEWPA